MLPSASAFNSFLVIFSIGPFSSSVVPDSEERYSNKFSSSVLDDILKESPSIVVVVPVVETIPLVI